MPTHAFVDETKAKGFVMAMTVIEAGQVAHARQSLRGVLLPRQRRVHFQKENHRRRAQIIETITTLPLTVRLYDAGGRPPHAARRAALTAIAGDLRDLAVDRLVIEPDEVFVPTDKETTNSLTADLRHTTAFAFHHLPSSAEPLLWVSDATAWCYARGGRWRDTLSPILDGIVRL